MTTAQLAVLLLLAPLLAAAQDAPPSDPSPPPPYGFTNFNPSMAIIIVVLISAFFFMGFFSIYIRQCGGDSSSVSPGRARNGSARARSRRAARGLDPALIATFPIFEYSVVKNLKLGKGTLECAVCLCEFDDEETLRLLPKCSHVFHPECIDMWLSSHVTCPVCRSNLAGTPTTDPVPDPDELTDLEAGSDSDHHPHDRSEHEVAVTIDEDGPSEQPEPAASAPNVINPGPNRPPRSGSSRRPKIAGRFPRSHSTGHSLVQPGENCERYTLRLPEHVRKNIMKGKLNRTTSCVAFQTEVSDGSVRRGHRSGGIVGEGSSRGRSFGRSDRAARSDRWVFSIAPPFISRSFSVRSPSMKRGGSQVAENGAGGTRMLFPSVKAPFDCLGGAKAGDDTDESGSARPQRSATPIFTLATSP